MCLSSAAVAKAGSGVNTDVLDDSVALASFSDAAEGEIVAETRRDFLTSYSDLHAGISGAVAAVCASKIAKQMIQYDMSGYTSLEQAQTMLDVQDDVVRKGMAILKDFKSNDVKPI